MEFLPSGAGDNHRNQRVILQLLQCGLVLSHRRSSRVGRVNRNAHNLIRAIQKCEFCRQGQLRLDRSGADIERLTVCALHVIEIVERVWGEECGIGVAVAHLDNVTDLNVRAVHND